MNRLCRWSFFLCVLAGCSTHPGTDFCDFVQPGKLYPNKVQPYGGVAIPQGPIIPVMQGGPTFPAGPIVPPPAPLPGNRPPGAVELQPPPLPPAPPPNFPR